ncbi:hypothetical protein B0H10DRAFT_1986672 [Mycena sp. CBHHK59/15]|nr:hypothetical protein B0H10DRAFT_1986672 [Mycena sp. CBHHK59/15]
MAVPPLNAYMVPIPCVRRLLTLSNRWEYSANGAIWSAWAGASIKFSFSGHSSPPSSLFMRLGPKTQRKDRWNGGTPMFAVTVSPTPNSQPSAVTTETFDGEAGAIACIWNAPSGAERLAVGWAPERYLVEIVLIDWASILEIDGFITDDSTYLIGHPTTQSPPMLLIGDSISCGFAVEKSQGGQPIPLGTLNAFPSHAMRLLRNQVPRNLDLEIVAYPGISLVGLNSALGMVDRFFRATPWDTNTWTPRGDPEFICIALGTNDEANDVEPDTFRTTLERFIHTLSTTFTSVKTFYIIPPFRDFNEADAGAIYRNLVSQPFTAGDIDIRICDDINSGITSAHTVDGFTRPWENFARFIQKQMSYS